MPRRARRDVATAAAVLLGFAGCAPPLPPLQVVWRPTPDDGRRGAPPESVRWQPSAAWSTVRSARLRNGIAVYGVARDWPQVTLTLAAPGAGVRAPDVSREELAVATRVVRSSLERAGAPGHPRLSASVEVSDDGSVLAVTAEPGDLAPAVDALRAALHGDGIADAALLDARDEAVRERHDYVGTAELLRIALRQEIYGEASEAARPATGYSDRIAAVTVPGVRRALGALLTSGSCIVLSGQFDFDESVARLDAVLGEAPVTSWVAPPTPRGIDVAEAHGVLLMQGTVPTRTLMMIGCPLGTSTADEAPAQDAFAAAIGGDLASRFAELLRGDRAMTYSYDVRVERLGGQATLFASTAVEAGRTEVVLESVLAHFDDLAAQGMSHADARRAIARLRSSRSAEWDSPWGVGPAIARSILRGDGVAAPTMEAAERPGMSRAVRALARACSSSRVQVAMVGGVRALYEVAMLSGRSAPRVLRLQPALQDP